MNTTETIAAVCTGAGGAIAIIRISGPQALTVANQVWQGSRPLAADAARQMLLGRAGLSGGGADTALAVYMPGPNSYTGDDIVEIQCHGGNLISRQILELALRCGARLAEPGEFTYRAFINGKMDLTQAEAVADLIGAGSEMALRLAERQVSGKLGHQIKTIRNQLTDILAECESRLDFPEENLDWTPPEKVNAQLDAIIPKLRQLLESSREGVVLRQGIRVVIAGRPNAGKSSLLNLLLGYDRAIVSAIPGTTRDTLEESATLRGIPIRLTDTAGIREADNPIEGLGIDRSKQSLKQAQLTLWLLDAAAPDRDEEVAEMQRHLNDGIPAIAVWNKIDIAPATEKMLADTPTVAISVLQRRGIDDLIDMIEKCVWEFPHEAEPELAVSARHADHLRHTLTALPEAIDKVDIEEWELVAVHLRECIADLGCITGETADPDILGNIFSRFCIGK